MHFAVFIGKLKGFYSIIDFGIRNICNSHGFSPSQFENHIPVLITF